MPQFITWLMVGGKKKKKKVEANIYGNECLSILPFQ